MVVDIKNRLEDLSYTINEQDNFLIDYLYKKVVNEISNSIGTTTIQICLNSFIIDRVCGLFLKQRNFENKLEDFSESQAITQIQEGDLSLTFKESESKIDKLCELLINENFDLSPYRRIVW